MVNSSSDAETALQLIAEIEKLLIANAKLEQRLEYAKVIQQGISGELLRLHNEKEKYVSIVVVLVALLGGRVEITHQQQETLHSISAAEKLSFTKTADGNYIISIL